MNNDWIDFLKTNNATITENLDIIFSDNQPNTNNAIIPITHLGIIKVTGKDAPVFLQGQLTCNINDISDASSFFAAFCNAKGRVISSLLILKDDDGFILLLPEQLIEKVINKLRMYVLRSDVKLDDVIDEYCLFGLTTDNLQLFDNLPDADFSVTNSSEIIIKFPAKLNRYLVVCSVKQGKLLWSQFSENEKISINNSTQWNYQDISAGIPWLTETTSEEYIPQMLNIDKLGGISFNKGCYTGQEIIARTHYLGKAKREMYLAECKQPELLSSDVNGVLDKKGNTVGKILSLQSNGLIYRFLMVIPSTEANSKNLILNDSNQARLKVIDFE